MKATTDQYRKYATPESGDEQFDAANFNPKAWAELAKEAGMKWMGLVARHHDGFSGFDVPHSNALTSVQTLLAKYERKQKVSTNFPKNWSHNRLCRRFVGAAPDDIRLTLPMTVAAKQVGTIPEVMCNKRSRIFAFAAGVVLTCTAAVRGASETAATQ